MVKELRNKFVLTTTVLMIVVFGGFLTVNTIYNNYWNGLEIAEMLEWISYNESFFEGNQLSDTEDLLYEMTEDESAISCYILDANNSVLSERTLGKGVQSAIPEEYLVKMSTKKNSSYKIGPYYYAYRSLEGGEAMIVVMDNANHSTPVLKIVGIIGLISIGIALLVLVAFILSKYVTEPAERSLNREKRFISDASHELKTPLGAISINAEALVASGEENPYLRNIISEASRMSRLIERLLTLSKMDEKEELEKNPVNLSDLCEEMALTYESSAFEKGVDYQYEIEPNLEMKAVEDELRQLLAILIDNAIKNTDTLGRIQISCKKDKHHSLIEVSNTGAGISEEDLPHVFERFYTTSTAREDSSFGLGLAIAKSIVERHGGELSVESELGKETRFKVFL